MQTIHLLFRDKAFFKKVRQIFPHDAEFSGKTERSGDSYLRSTLAKDNDLVIMDWRYISHLRDLAPSAKVMIVSDTYDKNKEYLSARLGAKGFITKYINTLLLKSAIDTVNAGQLWMTRAVAARVFTEYKGMFRGNRNMPEPRGFS